MPVDDRALAYEVGAPERIEDLLPSNYASCVRGQEVQQRLLERGEVHLVAPREHRSVEHIDLQVGDAQAWDKLPGIAVGPVEHGPNAGDQVVWNERNTDEVIGAALEGVKLPAKIAAPRQRDDADRPCDPRLIDELDRPTSCLEVDVEEKEMRPPYRERGLAVLHCPFGPPDITASVTEDEVDGVRHGPTFKRNQHSDRAVGISGGRRDRTHWGTDQTLHPALASCACLWTSGTG